MAIAGLYKIFDHWHREGTLFIYSDPHFDDTELAAGVANRPSAEEQVRMINSKVGRKDTIIFLGDIGNIEWIRKIRGYKILIMGNHDAGITTYKDVFQEIYSGPVMIGEKLILSHEPVDIPWAFNIHGHIHDSKHKNDKCHFNVCSDVIGYTPVNMNQFMKSGALSHIETIHRNCINKATKRKYKHEGKKIGEK